MAGFTGGDAHGAFVPLYLSAQEETDPKNRKKRQAEEDETFSHRALLLEPAIH
jgi:hypothetical protein